MPRLIKRVRIFLGSVGSTFSESYRLSHYDNSYFLDTTDQRSRTAYLQQVLRPNDLGACLCYAYGYTSYEEVCSTLLIRDDDRAFVGNLNFRQQLAKIKLNQTRHPKFVVDVGSGRGELTAAFTSDNVFCVGVDPSKGAEEWHKKTFKEWINHDTYGHFLQSNILEAFKTFEREEFEIDTVILCEAIEHIPAKQFKKTWPIIVKVLQKTHGLLVVANLIDFHPIHRDRNGWNHVRQVDDEFYDYLASFARKTVFRRQSHLVLQF